MSKALYFGTGLIIGSLATYVSMRSYFEKREQAAVDSVKESFGIKYNTDDDREDDKKKLHPITEEKPDIMEYAATIKSENYKDYSELDDEKPVYGDESADSKPYIIDADECGSEPDYGYVTMTYYADGVLCRDVGRDPIVDDPEDIIGDALEHFDDDVVYVRDDVLKIDYEIVKDIRTFEEVSD